MLQVIGAPDDVGGAPGEDGKGKMEKDNDEEGEKMEGDGGSDKDFLNRLVLLN